MPWSNSIELVIVLKICGPKALESSIGFCHMASLPILKTVLHSSNIFFNSNKRLPFMKTMLSVTCYCGGDAIIHKPFKYSVFHDRDILI